MQPDSHKRAPSPEPIPADRHTSVADASVSDTAGFPADFLDHETINIVERSGGRGISPSIVSGVMRLIDASTVIVLGMAIFAAYLGWGHERQTFYLAASVLGGLGVIQTYAMLGLYRFIAVMDPALSIRRLLGGTAIIFMGLVALAFLLKISAEFSRLWYFLWLAGCFVGVPLARYATSRTLRRWASEGELTRNIVIVGSGENARRLVTRLDEAAHPWNRVVGVFDDRATRRESHLGRYPILGDMSRLLEFARYQRVDQVIIAMPWTAEGRIIDLVTKLRPLPLNVGLCPDLAAFQVTDHRSVRIAGLSILEMSRRPISDWDMVVKTLFDYALGGVAFLCALPMLALIAAAVKLDSRGPVFFRQKRYGFNNQLIGVLKFRTMYIDQQDDTASKLATRDDPRITRVGRFLRRWSLDELPQIINVMKGEMSLVGPRPHAVMAKAGDKLYVAVLDDYAARHNVKPGITGWAQVNGWRGETDTELKLVRRVEHDLWYIENWSLRLDIKILLRTVFSVIEGENAY